MTGAETRELLSATLRSITDGIIATDGCGKIILANESAQKILSSSADKLLGQDITDLTKNLGYYPVHGSNEDHAGNQERHFKIQYAHPGDKQIIEINQTPLCNQKGDYVGIVWAIRDITGQVKKDEVRQKASKLDSLGVMAAGIAHDFNNLFTVVVGNLALAKIFLQENDEIIPLLIEAEQACFEAKGLTRQLLIFARGGAPVKKTVDIGQIARDSAMYTICGFNIENEIHIPDELCLADADPVQIAQVINNLIINAVQAMPHGGKISIRVENIHLAPGDLPLAPGDYVRIAIQDNGTGIPKQFHKNIFDPYFTTKEHSSGLGLTTSYAITRKHGGMISFDSQPSKGSIFFVYLPASSHHSSSLQPEEESLSGLGRLLIMDDDEQMHDVLEHFLDAVGYDVDQARDGTEALYLYASALQKQVPYTAVLADLSVSGSLDRHAFITKLLELDPNARIIVTSSNPHDPIMSEYKDWGLHAAIPKPAKPYSIKVISQTLNQMIKL